MTNELVSGGAAADKLLGGSARDEGFEREWREFRLRDRGADGADLEALLAYTDSPYAAPAAGPLSSLPLPDDPHIAVWREYAREAESRGAAEVLTRALVQLRFPVAAGISTTEEYRTATRRGESTQGMAAAAPGAGGPFEDPDGVHVSVHEAPVGSLPVIRARSRADFVTLVRALTARNEPEVIPDSMGALMVAGYNNWDRVRRYREAWSAGGASGEWAEEFKRLIPRKELYQDRFVLVSSGPYSGVPAEALGLGDAEWAELSAHIRIEHEATHDFTRRIFGAMRTNLLDELLADYMGIAGAIGSFRKDWLLRFLGLEDHPQYRAGGRFENYLGEMNVDGDAARILRQLIVDAAGALEEFDARWNEEFGGKLGGGLDGVPNHPTLTQEGHAHVLTALCRFTLVELATPGAALWILDAYRSLSGR